MRGQPGTPDLRMLAYMDEVFGYVPPTASPPAKKPILTILKQGRAFGCGLVLSTQNPVDLDYKAMSNAGTWLVGRLQTENDKARVLEGLRSAAGGTDVAALDAAIGGLQKRQFLLVSAKDSTPAAAGDALGDVVPPRAADEGAGRHADGRATQPEPRRQPTRRPTAPADAPASPTVASGLRAGPAEFAPDETTVAPPVAAGIPVSYLDPAAPWAAQVGADATGSRLRAFVAARVSLRYDDTAADVDERQEYEALYGPLDGGLDLDTEIAVDFDDRDFRSEAAPGAFVLPGAPIAEGSFWKSATRDVQRRIVDQRALELLRNRALKLVSRPGESPEDFAQRCDEAAQAAEDAETAKIRDRLEAKQDRLEAALAEAQRRVEQLDTDAKTRQANEVIAGAGAVLGALLGGRRSTRSMAGALSGAASRRGMSSRAASRRKAAVEKATDVQDDLAELEQEIIDEVTEIDARWREAAAEIETVAIRLEAADVRVVETRLVWVPSA